MSRSVKAIFRRWREVAPVRLIVASFFLVILVGTLLLTLPLSARDGKATHVLDAFFTATSATCVTGLVVFDTWTHWNAFGQAVILMLIQVGGLGIITFTTGFNLLLHKKIGLRNLLLARENVSGNTLDIGSLIKMILRFTFVCEGIGALLLMLRFVPKFGAHGVWISVFCAVSAFCNAGFDILGFELENGSLMLYSGDGLVCVTIALLIIVGGLGFTVISDIYYSQIYTRFHKQTPFHLNFHSQMVLITTTALLVVGTVGFFVAEYNNTMAGMPFLERLNASFFQSASARTAGYASINIAGEHDFTKLFTVALMFIGASPASTGGGIKTTTFAVLVSAVYSVMSGREETVMRRRRIDQATVSRSLAIAVLSFAAVLVTTGVILTVNNTPVSGVDALFEAVSAFGTVGLTANVTPILDPIPEFVVALTMFVGRVGPVSLALALIMRRGSKSAGAILPEGKLIVG